MRWIKKIIQYTKEPEENSTSLKQHLKLMKVFNANPIKNNYFLKLRYNITLLPKKTVHHVFLTQKVFIRNVFFFFFLYKNVLIQYTCGKPARRDYHSMFSSRGRTLRGCLIDDFKSMDPPSDSTVMVLAQPRFDSCQL